MTGREWRWRGDSTSLHFVCVEDDSRGFLSVEFEDNSGEFAAE